MIGYTTSSAHWVPGQSVIAGIDRNSCNVLVFPIVFSLQLLQRRDGRLPPVARTMLFEIDPIYHDETGAQKARSCSSEPFAWPSIAGI